MKFRQFYVHGYRSLMNFTMELNETNNVTLLVGENNTGKSTILKAINEIVGNGECEQSDLNTAIHIDQFVVAIVIEYTMKELIDRAFISIPYSGGLAGLPQRQYRINYETLNNLNIPIKFFLKCKKNNSRVEMYLYSVKVNEKATIFQRTDESHYWTKRIVMHRDNSYEIFKKQYNLRDTNGFQRYPDKSNAVALFKYSRGKIRLLGAPRETPQSAVEFISSNQLDINATNLIEVLATLLINDRDKWDKIQTIFNNTFKSLRLDVKVENNKIEISLNDGKTDVPITSCGTGLFQFLAIAYNILGNIDGLILLDEPHAFLHPSAEKELYKLIKNDDQHQYIIATHSPLAINILNNSIYTVKLTDRKTVVRPAAPMETHSVIKSLGISPSDLYQKSIILFVEGPSDAAIIPHILDQCKISLDSLNACILPLRGTGNHEIPANILEMLSKIVGDYQKIFILVDGNTDADCVKKYDLLARNHPQRIYFYQMKKPEIEDYLLESSAIAKAIISKEPALEKDETSIIERVKKSLDSYALDIGLIYSGTSTKESYEKKRLAKITKGSQLLDSLFKEFSIHSGYSKTDDWKELFVRLPEKYFTTPGPDFITEIKRSV